MKKQQQAWYKSYSLRITLIVTMLIALVVFLMIII